MAKSMRRISFSRRRGRRPGSRVTRVLSVILLACIAVLIGILGHSGVAVAQDFDLDSSDGIWENPRDDGGTILTGSSCLDLDNSPGTPTNENQVRYGYPADGDRAELWCCNG